MRCPMQRQSKPQARNQSYRLKSGCSRCQILTFDSLGGGHNAVVKNLRMYLDREAVDKQKALPKESSGQEAVEVVMPASDAVLICYDTKACFIRFHSSRISAIAEFFCYTLWKPSLRKVLTPHSLLLKRQASRILSFALD